MEFTTRTLESDPGMSQKEALLSLQKHPSFIAGTVISSIRRRKNTWVAELLEPKTAEFPPPKDDGGDEESASESPAPSEPKSEGPESDGPPTSDSPDESSEDGPDGPPAPGGDKGGEKPGKGGTETAILHTLQQILHALQGGGAPEGLGGPDALGPGAGGPPGGPPKGGKPPFGGPKPMKPGDTPPGGTPVGAPAFASRQANPSVPPTPGAVGPAQGTPVPSGQAGPTQGGVCPQCGGPEPCPMHSGGLGPAVASYAGKAATINLSTPGTDVKQAVEEARPVLHEYGYQVKQAKRGDGQIHILASRR
jgi:hypothetical protein